MKRLILFAGIDHKNMEWATEIEKLHTIFDVDTLILPRDNEFQKAVTTGNKYWLSPIVSVEPDYELIQLVYIVTDSKILPTIKSYFDEIISSKIHGIFARKFTDDSDIFELLTRLQSGGLVKTKTIDMSILETSQNVRYIK